MTFFDHASSICIIHCIHYLCPLLFNPSFISFPKIMKQSFSTILAYWWLASHCSPSFLVSSQEVCTPCADGLDAFLVGKVCENGIDLATTLTTDMVECQVLQLAMYQGDCCDTPPEGYCTLCENGSQNYNADKVIPPNAGGPTFEVTCDNFATRNMYLREGATGICSDTERARARAWCECDGILPACTLTCSDGNPPPDMTKADPIFGETCERFAYEYSTLSAEECSDPALNLNFDAKAFCCNEPEPDNCSICSPGKMLGDPDTIVQTEFFGSATCGEIDTYASYLPVGACSRFVDDLLDNPFGAEDACCVTDPNFKEGGGNGEAGCTRTGNQLVATSVACLFASSVWSLFIF